MVDIIMQTSGAEKCVVFLTKKLEVSKKITYENYLQQQKF